MSQTASTPTPREVTTLDLLKTLAVVLMIADHIGLYVLPGNDVLRILGRPAAIIFGFLIGHSPSTRIPPSWIGLGLGLTLLNGWLLPQDSDQAIDILIGLALTRAVMPLFERLYDTDPLTLVPAGVGLALLAEPLNQYLEYGGEVTLVALLGLAVRRNAGTREQIAGRDAIALVALVGMSLIALRHFEFTGWMAAGCTTIIAVTILLLAQFRRTTITGPQWLVPLLRFGGRNSLWIYALHLAALIIGTWWVNEDE